MPPATWSASHRSSSDMPAATRSARRATVFGLTSRGFPAAASRRAVRTAWRIDQSCTQPGGSAEATLPADHRNSSASTCLHGTLRLGQEQWYTGCSPSAAMHWYGADALPRLRPHTRSLPASLSAPESDQRESPISSCAARWAGTSGASASTRSALHGSAAWTTSMWDIASQRNEEVRHLRKPAAPRVRSQT
jgi:hypothetical protein